MDAVVLFTALPVAQAESIAQTLVDEQYVACVNLFPITSVYRWKGAVQKDAEIMALLKTTRVLEPHVRARLVELHPYEVPEVIALDLASVHPPYLQWIIDSVRAPK
jgi:periplasmic divalent cation tolerance protein